MVQRPGTAFCGATNVIADDVENISSWYNSNRLKLNVDKSCIMYIGSIQRLNSLNIRNTGCILSIPVLSTTDVKPDTDDKIPTRPDMRSYEQR